MATMLSTDDLSVFVDIARAGSISCAAKLRGQSKSGLSRRLSDLEARLGVSLIARTTRSHHLTEAGETLLARAQLHLDELAETEAMLHATSTTLSGRLRIAAPLSFGLGDLRPVLSGFIRAHPALKVEVDFSDRRVDLIEEGFDVALRIGTLADSSLIAKKVAPMPSSITAAPAFWDTHGRPEKPADLAALPYLGYLNAAQPDTLRWWGPGGASGTLKTQLHVLAGNGEFLAGLAADSCGYLCDPDFITQSYLDDGRLERVLPDYAWSQASLWLVFPPSRRMAARTRAFADAVIAALGKT